MTDRIDAPHPAVLDPAQSVWRGRLFRKYVASFVAIVSMTLIVNGVVNAWFSSLEQKRLLIGIQREQADTAASKIGQFIGEIEAQLGVLTKLPAGAVSREDQRIDAIRLLRLSQAISEVAQFDSNGREQLRISRFAMDAIDSQKDFSQSAAFRGAKQNGVYYGPVYFVRETEPFMTLALAGAGNDAPVSVAEVNLRFIWDLVARIAVGTTGNAYVADREGILIAHPDLWQALRKADLSDHDYVRAALSGTAPVGSGKVVYDFNGRSVLSTYAKVPSLGWLVFVELPVAEAYAPIYASLARSAAFLAGLLVCAILAALFLSRRMTIPIQMLTRGAARIGSGELNQRLAIRTGDEFEALGEQFNQMAAQLSESYTSLEGKVAARTVELAQARDQAWAQHAEAQAARKAAELANETKSRFLAVVSHELRTPLNGVMSVLQLLDDRRLDASQQRHLKTAAVSGETLLALIDAILEYARLEAGTEVLERRNFHLGQLIEAAVDLMRPQVEAKNLAFGLTLDVQAAAYANGDPVRLNRVLLNLIGNAIKFTEAGHIDVSALVETRSPSERILRILVSDTGIGVAAEMQERIFEDFVQADDSIVRRFGGTGLGLAISRRLARLMGGDLTIASVAGEGATFCLTMPLATATDTAAPVRPIATAEPLTVLLVDDDPVNREVGEALLRRLGHRPMVVADGEQAIALAQNTSFDAILMDLHMPGIDGFEAAKLIAALSADPTPRIVAVTADVSERSRERMASAGFDAVVSKPILLDALQRALVAGHDGKTQHETQQMHADEVQPAPGLIDDVYFAGHLDILGAERLSALRDVFVETAAGLSQTIAAAAHSGDHSAHRRAVHQLGSAASALGLGRLFARCTFIELNAASMSADELRATADEFETLRRMSLSALDERLRTSEIAAMSGA